MMTEASMKYIVARLVENANEALTESRREPKDAYAGGRREAYYEVLDVLKSELDAHDADLSEFGLTLDPDAML